MRNQRIKNKIYINLLLILAIFAIIYLFIYPQYSGKGTLYSPSKNIAGLLKDKRDYTGALEVADSYNAKVIKINTDYTNALNTLPIHKLNRVLPSENDPILTIYELVRIAARPESRMAIVSPRYNDDGDTRNANKKYNTLSISFSVDGTYEELKAFLRNLESSEKIFNVTSLDFNSSQDTKALSSLKYSLTVETYYLK